MEKTLNKIYYNAGGFMSYNNLLKAAQKEIPDIDPDELHEWLNNQKIYQEHKRSQSYSGPKAHFNESIPNHTHQADILFMPHFNKFKYILTVVDVATRYKAARALRDKTGDVVWRALQDIYSNTLLKPPEIMMTDSGTEFNETHRQLTALYNTVPSLGSKYNHKHTAIVERFNRTLSERLFKAMEHRENEQIDKFKQSNKSINGIVFDYGVDHTKKAAIPLVDKRWVDDLPGFVDALNSEKTRMIGMSPNEAMQLANVEQPIDTTNEESDEHSFLFDIGDHVKYLLEDDETVDRQRRVTDKTYSFHTFTVYNIVRQAFRPTYFWIEREDDNGKVIRKKKGYKYNELLKID